MCLPPEAREGEKWDKRDRPVVRLALALYGHPDSGTCSEKHCDAHLRKVGFRPISEVWSSCYFHDQLKLFLVLYVDDFKLAGPKANLAEGWKIITSGLHMQPPTALVYFLGVITAVERFVSLTVLGQQRSNTRWLASCDSA